MFSCRDMQGHPKQKLPNVILFHCITTNMKKASFFWREEGECHFMLLSRKPTHMSISHKQRRTRLRRGHSFRKTPSSSLQFPIDFQLTSITVEMLETLDNLPAPLHSGKTCKGRGHSIIGYRVQSASTHFTR